MKSCARLGLYTNVEANDNASVFHRGITNLLNFPEYRVFKGKVDSGLLDDNPACKNFVYRECENAQYL